MAKQESRSEISVKMDGIAHLLRDRRLAVPAYQRSFAWDIEQVETFWEDLKACMTLDDPEYFLGTVVLSHSADGTTEIIDGQQRLATTTMLLAAIRNVFLRSGDLDRASVIEKDYLAGRSLRSAEVEPRLTLNSHNHAHFQSIVIAHPPTQKKGESNSSNLRIEDAFLHLTSLIDREVKSAGKNWDKLLFQWTDFLETGVRVVVFDAPSDADAFLLFETMNDRGLELSVADLLKNYLFGRSGRSLSVAQEHWQHALEEFPGESEQLFVTFLRHYWSSVKGATRERDLYRSFRSEIRSESQALKLVSDISSAALDYSALLNSQSERWADFGRDAADAASTLLRLGLEQNRPLLIAAMEKFSEKEVKKLLIALVNWSVRGIIVGGIGGGKTERYFSNAAVGIREGNLRTSGDVYRELNAIIPSDEEFVSAFTQARVTTSQMATYFLSAIENFQTDKKLPAIIQPARLAAAAAIPILPTGSASSGWKGFDEDELTQFNKRLGNFALIDTTNQSVSSSDNWDKKLESFRSTELATSRPIAKARTWTPDAIRVRQEELSRSAAKIWPREP